jgi:branched-chain amino acid transport system permease protein
LNATLRTSGVVAGALLASMLAYVVVVDVLGQRYNATTVTLTGAFALAGLGLTLMLGLMHQYNLGQAFFIGLGAYVYAVLAGSEHGWPPVLAVVAAVSASVAVALVVGRVLLRLDGFYFAVATLGMGLIGENVLLVLRDVTGGVDGLTAPEFEALGFAFDTPLRQHVLVGGCLAIAFGTAWNLARSRRGRAARAIGHDEMMAAANGIDAARAKTQMFVLSSVYATTGGCLYAAVSGYVFPSVAGLSVTLELVVAVILGGMSSLVGTVAALGLLRSLPIVFEPIEEHIALIHGITLVALLVVLPSRPQLRRWRPQRRRSRPPRPAATTAATEARPEPIEAAS